MAEEEVGDCPEREPDGRVRPWRGDLYTVETVSGAVIVWIVLGLVFWGVVALLVAFFT